MSAAWDAHYKRISDLIAANPVQRAPAAAVAPPVTVQPGVQAMLPAGLLDMWQGGGNGGQMGMPGGVDYGGKPGDMGDLSGLFGGINPGTLGGWGGGLVGGLLAGPFGALAGSVGGRALAGLLGGNETNTGAGMLGNDAKDMPGMMNAGFGDMGGGGGQDMGGANSNAGKEGDTGAMNGWQSGGYTGAGRDGKVQPGRVAGLVHEGEYVIPAPVVQGLLSGQRAGPFPTARRK